MQIEDILTDKNSKPKEKTEKLARGISTKKFSMADLIKFAKTANDSQKATCIEAIEFATKDNPKLGDKKCLQFAAESLTEKAPRVKWESAKVIGNIAHLHPDHLQKSVKNLLDNTEHSGTVVRWSSAFALGEIIKLKTPLNKQLLPAIESICKREEKNSIKKIYIAAIKKLG